MNTHLKNYILGFAILIGAYVLLIAVITLLYGANHIFDTSSCNLFQEKWLEKITAIGVRLTAFGVIGAILYPFVKLVEKHTIKFPKIHIPKWVANTIIVLWVGFLLYGIVIAVTIKDLCE